MKRTLGRAAWAVSVLAILAGCEKLPVETPEPDILPGKWMELPAIPADPDSNLRVVTHYESFAGNRSRNYTILYDTDEKVSYWVAYPQHSIYLNRLEREDNWAYDPQVDPSLQAPIMNGGYGWGSGFDRGHQIANADRTSSRAAADQTFYATNITPQNSTLNQGEWALLEGWVRSKALQGGRKDTLYVVTGCVVRTADDPEVRYESKYGTAIPKGYFKVLARTNSGKAGFPVNSDVQCIGFWMENKPPAEGWQQHVKTVAEIEQITGHTFFPSLSAKAKSRYWPGDWGLK